MNNIIIPAEQFQHPVSQGERIQPPVAIFADASLTPPQAGIGVLNRPGPAIQAGGEYVYPHYDRLIADNFDNGLSFELIEQIIDSAWISEIVTGLGACQMLQIGMQHGQLPPPPPVVAVKLKKTTAEVIRGSQPAPPGGPRGEIFEISQSSRKNAIEVLANANAELSSMLCPTYPDHYPNDGRIVKCHHKRLIQALQREYGDFSYFTAVEYQKRGAPHLHIAIGGQEPDDPDQDRTGVHLRDLGDLTKLKRGTWTRRKPAFETVKAEQDRMFEMWIEIISVKNPTHNGQTLDWSGLTTDDEAKMRLAYTKYNAGFSWEIMREKNGASRYLVKELTGLKGYQKQVPADFKHPGRHFLYSDDMKFDDADSLTFFIGDGELRGFLEKISPKHLDKNGKQILILNPKNGKPLFKWLWNVAELLAIELVEAGYVPMELLAAEVGELAAELKDHVTSVKTSIQALRKYWDLRMFEFSDHNGDMWRNMAWNADTQYILNTQAHWERIKRKFRHDDMWGQARAPG